MEFELNDKNPVKHFIGFFLLVLHVIVVFVFISGMARLNISVPKDNSTIVKIIEQIKPPPPENLPPPPPKMMAPPTPPVFIPESEVTILQAPLPQPVIAETLKADVPPPATAPVQRVEETDNVDTIAMLDYKGCQLPAYPYTSQRDDEEGSVILSLLVDTDGHVIDSKVDRSSGHNKLDDAARVGMALCKFKPAMKGGQATRSWKKLEYVWKLGNQY